MYILIDFYLVLYCMIYILYVEFLLIIVIVCMLLKYFCLCYIVLYIIFRMNEYLLWLMINVILLNLYLIKFVYYYEF